MRVHKAALAAGVLGAAVVVAAVVALTLRHERGAVVGSPKVEFIPREPREPSEAKTVAGAWPMYGRDAGRLRTDAESQLRPPFTVRWTFHGGSLLEFPPALASGKLIVPTFAGRLVALDPSDGSKRWEYTSHRCSWATPAVTHDTVYETFLLRSPRCEPHTDPAGQLIAFDEETGRIRWHDALPATESSPVVANGLVYIGDWSGAISAFEARTGRLRWRYRADGPVKASVAISNGRAYVGAYDGRLYALDARTGHLAWRSSTHSLLRRRGALYSTPAVAYGRVYVGSTDGSVYSFGARSGRLRWRRPTGGYVYSSPAVWRHRVFIGSYDGHLYALDAATGRVRWRFAAGAPISGAPVVLGNVVYVSTLRERTIALRARTGGVLWTFPDGKYTPAVADDERLYLVGYDRLFGMTPSGARQ